MLPAIKIGIALFPDNTPHGKYANYDINEIGVL